MNFLYSSGRKTFSVCTCAKCGSTSLYLMLYSAVAGRQYPYYYENTSKPLNVHNFAQWGLRNVTRTEKHGDVHFIMTRDPVERYLSAFFSKIQCCADNRSRCFSDRDDKVPMSLLRLASRPRKGCMTFEEYTDVLEELHTRNMQQHMDDHVMPQDLTCQHSSSTPTFVFDVRKAGQFLNSLHGYGLHRVDFPHMHRSPRWLGTINTTRLQALAEREYRFLASR